VIWIAAIFAFFFFEPNRHPEASRWDTPRLHELGYFTDIWARWDSDFFLRVAQNGYDGTSAAFHPLYPALVAVLGRVLFGHYLLAGLIVSLACCLGSFLLLYRLAEERLGPEGAERSVLYLAVFPMSLFLQAVYSESSCSCSRPSRSQNGTALQAQACSRVWRSSRALRASPCCPLLRCSRGGSGIVCARSAASRSRFRWPRSIRSCSGNRSTTPGRSRTHRTAGTGTSHPPAR